MKAISTQIERASETKQPRPIFKCVIVYEDAAAGQRGERFYQNLLASMDTECTSTRNLWSFTALTIREMRNIAASAASVADIVIFALSRNEPLPAKVKEWIEMWLWLIDGAHPALVPLFNFANAESAAIESYLLSVTASKHLDYFPHSASFDGPSVAAPRVRPELPMQGLREPRHSRTRGSGSLVGA